MMIAGVADLRFLTQGLAGIIIPLTLREKIILLHIVEMFQLSGIQFYLHLFLTCSCSSSHLSQTCSFKYVLQQSIYIVNIYFSFNYMH